MTTSTSNASCAIVVTFYPDATALLKLLGQLNKETDFIVIDNGSPDIGRLADSITVYTRCREFLRLPENEGLARALNRGIDWALNNGKDFVFMFDQDSSLCDLFISRMITSYRKLASGTHNIAAVGPRIINPQTMRQTPFKVFNRFFWRSDRVFANSASCFVADFLITSGTLLVLQHLQKIGKMKEEYFIDNVDLEWCFRAKARGFTLIGTDDAVLYHAIGERSENPLVRAGIMAQHKPFRTYYSSRNRIHLYGMRYAPLGWKLRDIARFTLKAAWLLLSSPERKSYWINIRKGIRDAKTVP